MAERLARLGQVLIAAALQGCASSGGEVAIPPGTASGGAPSAAPPASALPLPDKDLSSSRWEVNGALCVRTWATDLGPAGICGERLRERCNGCTFILSEVLSKTERAKRGDACCYDRIPDEPMGVGRPLLGRDGPLLAPLERSLEPSRRVAAHPELVAAWERDARLEHASVAAFAELALELLALGAPARLIRGAHEAALDELDHASLCLALARAHGGTARALGALPLGGARPRARSLGELARRSWDEGCAGEGLASAAAERGAALACEPGGQVSRVLERIAADEARHAELAARVVGWAFGSMSPGERRDFLEEGRGVRARRYAAPEGLEAHGRVGSTELARLEAAVRSQVLVPLLAALGGGG